MLQLFPTALKVGPRLVVNLIVSSYAAVSFDAVGHFPIAPPIYFLELSSPGATWAQMKMVQCCIWVKSQTFSTRMSELSVSGIMARSKTDPIAPYPTQIFVGITYRLSHSIQ